MTAPRPSAGTWLRAVRAVRHLSQSELAGLAGRPTSTISRIESGACDPRFVTFRALLAATGHEIIVCDQRGRLVLLDEKLESVADRGGRHLPAHLRRFRVPPYDSIHYRDWWGWDRIAWPLTDDWVPEYTFRRRRRPPESPARTVDHVERGLLWDDAT